MAAYKPLSIVRHGRRYNASWHVEGKSVYLSSAYGSKSSPVAKQGAVEVAERLLAEIVDALKP